jgi:hypothetical protein
LSRQFVFRGEDVLPYSFSARLVLKGFLLQDFSISKFKMFNQNPNPHTSEQVPI